MLALLPIAVIALMAVWLIVGSLYRPKPVVKKMTPLADYWKGCRGWR